MNDSSAGWHPAPDAPGQQRYYDGTQWTDHYAPAGQQAPAGGAPYPPQKKGGASKVLIPVLACLGIAAIAAIIGVAVAGSADDEDTASNGGDDVTTEAAGEPGTSGSGDEGSGEDTYAVGETGTSSDLEITVNTVEDPWVPSNEFDTPPAGQRYVGVEMTVVNTGDQTATFSTLAGIEVVDEQGQAWDVALTASDQPGIDGDIPAGATRKGWVYLAVGEDATGLQMRVKGSLTAEGALFLLS